MYSLDHVEDMVKKIKAMLCHIEVIVEDIADEAYFDPTLTIEMIGVLDDIELRLQDIISE